MSARHKGKLKMRIKILEERLQSVCKNFGDNIIDDVAKTNRSEVANSKRPHLFRNKGYEGMILLFEEIVFLKKNPIYCLKHLL